MKSSDFKSLAEFKKYYKLCNAQAYRDQFARPPTLAELEKRYLLDASLAEYKKKNFPQRHELSRQQEDMYRKSKYKEV
jgi:hypothetical protein